mgnify:FL=1|tara:strand:+ start:1714 stop:2334 length:621 start_codon:yes stop_codon:yes gene_type:complete
MKHYHQLISYGDQIELETRCNPDRLLKEIKDFEWKQYNPRKEINRYGLSVTSSDGTRNGIDLDSLYEYNRENNTKFDEDSFKTFTDVYYKSEEVQKLVEPFKPWLWRTHFLNFRKGGYFPPHRDMRTSKEQKSMRLLVPISLCNPSDMYFMYEDKPLYFKYGSVYFLNTNKKHSIFSYSDKAIMLVMNVECTEDSVEKVTKLFRWK